LRNVQTTHYKNEPGVSGVPTVDIQLLYFFDHVEEERAVQSRREWREEKQAHAGLASRLKWTLVGMPEPPEDVEATP